MKTPSDPEDTGPSLRDKIIGLGERSIRKSYYPQLRQQLEDAEKSRSQVEEKSAALLNMLEDLEQARSSLADSQAQYRLLVENINDVIFSMDINGAITYVSPVVQNFVRLMPEQIIGRPFTEFIHPDDQSNLRAGFEHVLAGQSDSHEFRLLDNEGGFRHVRTSSRPLLEEGRVVGLTGVISDITERKLDEEALRRLNRELRAISNCNQALMRAENEQTLLDDICRIICDEAGYRMAWVGYPENDPAKTIRPVAWAGIENGYLAQAGISWADTERGRGPSGIAIRSGKSTGIGDFSTAPNAAPWREAALQRGYRSSISLPLKDEDADTFGILTIYSTEPNAFTPNEIRLLEELAGDMAFGIMVLRTRIERRQAETAMRESEEKYRTLIQNIQAAVVVHSADTQIIISNSMAQEILGLTEDQLLGKMAIDPAWHFFREDGTAAPLDEYPVNKVLATRKPLRNHILGVHRPDHKSDVWALVNADPVFGKDNELAQIIVTFIDISERVQAEQALRVERGLFVAGPSVVFKWRAQEGWPVEYVSPNVAHQFGYAPEDLVSGKVPYSTIVHPDDIARVAAEVSAFSEQGVASFEQMYRIAGADGHYRWVDDFTTIIRGLDGAITHYLGYLQDITERKRVESELAQREYEYRTLAENSPDVIVRYDREGRRIYVNPEFERVNRLTAQQVLGKTPAELSTELKPKADVFTERLMAAMESGTTDRIDLSWESDGKQVCWFVRVVPEFGAGGKVMSALTIWSDISERKLTEETLRREQALLNRIMVTSPVGIAVVNREGQITFANPQAEKILGLSKQEITQRSYNAPEWHTTAIDGGPFPDEAQPFSRVMATRQPVFDVQHAIVWPDGRRVLLSINGAPIFDAKGEIEGVAFAIEDITARKHAEDELRRNEFGLAEAQRIAHLGSWHLDLATNEVHWSEELYKIYGFDPALPPPLYTESMKLFTPESWERLSSAIARATETGVPYELELETVNKDGGKGWMLARGELVRDARGAAVGVRGVVMDITGRKQAEEEIRKLNQELEQRVAERTGELEAANKELEAFSYSVSHDLRTPLRAIDGFSHILLEDYANKLDDEGKRLLNVVRNNTSRMGQLIDDILKFSRAGRLEINYSEIDMEQLAYSVSVELRPVVAGDKLQLEIEHLPPARGDGAMMRQVFVNLLSNALKFSRAKETPMIKVGSYIHGDEAIYFVKDNGAGFDMKFVDKLFGVFQRLHSVNEFEGTGIGLAIVKRIVTRHGGRVWAEGKVNEGATIYFSLPNVSPNEVMHRN